MNQGLVPGADHTGNVLPYADSHVAHTNQPCSALNLLEITGRAAAYSAFQQPLDGASQLVGLKTQHYINDEPQHQFNTPEWYASTIGHGLGAVLPFLSTSKVTGLAWKETGVAKSITDGALSAFVFTPATGGSNGISQRTLAAFDSGVMFGTQQVVASKLASKLGPLVDTAPEITRATIQATTRLATNTASGAIAGLTSLEAGSLVSGHGPVTDHQTLLENTVASASTGFALEATHLGADGRKYFWPSKNSANESEPATFSRSHGEDFNPEYFSPAKQYEPTGDFAGKVHEVGTWQTEFLAGKKYETTTGQTFLQSTDGRIFHGIKEDGTPTLAVWTPHSTIEPATGYMGISVGEFGRQIFQRHEPQGFQLNAGRIDKPELANDYAPGVVRIDAPVITDELRAKLEVPLPAMLEPEYLAAGRILPFWDGRHYMTDTYEFRQQKAGEVPQGISEEQFEKDWIEYNELPVRRYKILSSEGSLKSSLMEDASPSEKYAALKPFATEVVVPEAYAQALDKLRDLRAFATLDPNQTPERQDEILAARRELYLSPLKDRYLPEHWGQFVDVLPNPQTIRHLVLADWELPTFDGKGAIAAAQRRAKVITFYADNNGAQQHVRRTLMHEWSHLTEDIHPELRKLYDIATRVDSDFVGRRYARYNTHENFAVDMAEMILDPNPELFLTMAQHAPVRTVILGEILRRELNSVGDQFSDHAEPLRQRLQYIDQVVFPIAKEKLADRMLSPQSLSELKETTDFLRANNYLARELQRGFNFDDLDCLAMVDGETLRHNWNTKTAVATLLRLGYLKDVHHDSFDKASSKAERLYKGLSKVLESTVSSNLRGIADHPTLLGGDLDIAEIMINTKDLRKLVKVEDLKEASKISAKFDPKNSRRAAALAKRLDSLSGPDPHSSTNW